MKVRRGVFCRLHQSFFCCGRKQEKRIQTSRTRRPRYGEPKSSKWEQVKWGEWRIEDLHHPRGYRVRLSKPRMEQLLRDKVEEQEGKCCLCGEKFTDLREVTPEHKAPSSMGGANRDDHPDNIGAAHGGCNFEKGSRRTA